MKKDYNIGLLEFIKNDPTPFHVIAAQAAELEQAGFERLYEQDAWHLKRGGRYYVTRNGSAIIAFTVPEELHGFMIMASHSDSPAFKIKESPEMSVDGAYTKLNVEVYGGGIYNTWMDRPLSVAGRLMVRTPEGVRTVLADAGRDLALIPNLAIHMNREINKGYEYNVQKDMLPLIGEDGASIRKIMAEAAGVDADDIVASDLFLYNRTPYSIWGADNEFMSSPKLDDLACAYASLQGLLEADTEGIAAVHAVFDNEEVGSSTIQGAASTFLKDTLTRINLALGGNEESFIRAVAESFMLSADNGHAIHPNHPEKCDPVVHPHMGGGVMIKFSANQKYTSDAESAAICKALCENAGVRTQYFFNRSDMTGGSTLGNISDNNVAVKTVDVGLAQLAMHSSYETCSTKDLPELIGLARALFSSRICRQGDEIRVQTRQTSGNV